MKYFILSSVLAVLGSITFANQISEDQMENWYPHYSKQANIIPLEKMLLNTDPEPKLKKGFVDLFNGETLDGWVSRGGECTFEVKDETIIGTCVPKSPSTYLSTVRDDFTDFIFTCEVKYLVDGNSGIQFRSRVKEGKGNEIVFGPQVEMEEQSKARGWSGGIYGQSCGGYFYPLWLDAHKAVREAVNYDGWNRVTVKARGKTIKTWINGIPAAHVKNDEYLEGFFSLQVHSGKQGTLQFRNIRVKELIKK